MTSNTDQNEFVENADVKQVRKNQVRSHSSDLENILNSLGHAVTDSQKRNEEALRGMGARARELGSAVVNAKENIAYSKADIFGGLENQMSDLVENIDRTRCCETDEHEQELAGETRCLTDQNSDNFGDGNGSVGPCGQGISHEAEWDQKAADELAQIYSEIDIVRKGEELGEVRAPIFANSLAGNGGDASNEALVAQLDAADDVPYTDLSLIESSFVEIAARIEDVLNGAQQNPALKSIEMRFDYLEEKLNSLIEMPEVDGGVHAREGQMGELNDRFQHVVNEISRIVVIEENVKRLIEEFNDSKSDFETALAGIAGSSSSESGLDKEQVEQKNRLVELQDALESYIRERRNNDEHTNGAIASIQSGIDDIAEYLVSRDQSLGAPTEEKQAAVDNRYVDSFSSDDVFCDERTEETDIAQNSDLAVFDGSESERAPQFDGDELDFNSQSDVPREVLAASPHGAAQQAFAARAMAEVDGEAETLAVRSSDQPEHIELDALSEVAFATETKTNPGNAVDESKGSLENDLPEIEPVMASDDVIAEDVDNGTILPVQESEEQSRTDALTPQLVAQRDQMVVAAREAAQGANTKNQDTEPDVDPAVKAENFLASARQAAREAALRAAAEEQEQLQLKVKKKKRGLFSFRRSGPSPVLVVATTLLTMTTAGLVYSQIKDQPTYGRIALGSGAPVLTGGDKIPASNSGLSDVPTAKFAKSGATSPSAQMQNSSVSTEASSSEEKRILINDVPHHRSENTGGLDVPVGIIVDVAEAKPDIKQLARLRRHQRLAKMSSDLTSGQSVLPVTKAAIRPDNGSIAPTAGSRQNNAPTLALPPSAIGPFSLRVAASKGDAGSQFKVGTRYAQGRGIKRNYVEAAKWYGRAAAQGHAIAQYRLAALYEKGQGLGKDLARARIWYRRSAEKGNIKAMHNLAVLYTGRNSRRPDYSTAAHWFKSAAERGLADSQFNLAILFANGLGVKRSIVEAYKWFALAAQRGDKEAARRRDALRTTMSAGQLKSAQKLMEKWQGKPVTQDANNVHKAAVRLKKSEANIDRNKQKLVARAQSMLAKLGYGVGVADGKIGPRTLDAIRNFQKRSGLKVNGDVTPELITRLSGLVG